MAMGIHETRDDRSIEKYFLGIRILAFPDPRHGPIFIIFDEAVPDRIWTVKGVEVFSR